MSKPFAMKRVGSKINTKYVLAKACFNRTFVKGETNVSIRVDPNCAVDYRCLSGDSTR
jgi:hypothetical protein